MKYRFSALPFKILAYVLAAVCLFAGAAGLYLGIGRVYDSEGLEERTYQETWRCREAVVSWSHTVADRFHYNQTEQVDWARLLRDTDFRFVLLNEATGQVLASYTAGMELNIPDNLGGNPYLKEYNDFMELEENYALFRGLYVIDFYYAYDQKGAWQTGEPLPEVHVPEDSSVTYQVLCLLPQTLTAHAGDIIWDGSLLLESLNRWFTLAAVAFGCGLVGLLVCLIFLCCQAGHKPGEAEVLCGGFHRIPLDLLLAAAVAAALGCCMCFCVVVDAYSSVHWTVQELYVMIGALSAATAFCGEVVLSFFVSLAVRFKVGRWWESCLIYRFVAWLWRWTKRLLLWIWRMVRRVLALLSRSFGQIGHVFVGAVRSVGMVPRAMLACLIAGSLDLLLMALTISSWNYTGFWVLLLLFYNLFLLAAVVYAMGQMKQLQEGAEKLSLGNLDYQLDTSRMYWDFKRHGDYLNAIADGMNKAVEQRMKSERLKTELITNVSHDIKTPLTSIVNYVDLLQKPHTEAEGVQYLEVLDRQSKRLKRLTENLVEASKASTGNMPVNLAPLSVMELVNQALEEYRERMDASMLETIVSLRGDLTIQADGKLMWRILDNLLNNVVKYALAGTRVYVTAQRQHGLVTIAVKNISRDPLNVDADELMERFVRGDSSRSTEGSGLGLNIARSLTQLQKGDFRLTVDGDLFKAEVILPVSRETQSAEPI